MAYGDPLTERDYQALEARWITRGLADLAQIRRVNSREGALLVGRAGAGDFSGIAIPNFRPGANCPREFRLRRDNPDLEYRADGTTRETGKYLHPPGRGNLIYIMPGTSPDVLADTSVPIIATEGEFKTIALSRLDGFLAVGFSGVWNWKGKRGIEPGSRRQINGPIPDLDMIAWTGRRVYVIFDSDAARNAAIRSAQFALCDELESRGAIAYIIELPDLEGLEKTGADDFLAHADGGPQRLLQLIQSASPVKPPTVAELLDASGISALTKESSQDEVQAALRSLADAPGMTRMDKLGLASMREAVIKHLASIGIRAPAAMTDAALAAVHKEDTETAQLFADPDPWPERVNGAVLLDEIVSTLKRYIVLADEAASVTALWSLHTHAAEASEVFPRLTFTSPEKRCGKTRGQEVIELIVSRPLRTGSITSAALFRLIEKFKPTLLIDEADTFFSEHEELRGIVNLGHRVGGFVPRCEGDDNAVRLFRAWGPLSIACIGNLPDTTTDRSIEIRMRRKKPEEKVARFRVKSVKRELADLPRKAARWAKDNLEILRHSSPELPNSLNDRQADNWEPLLAIADLVGGEWPERTRKAAVVLSGSDDVLDERVGPQLLADLRIVFGLRTELWTKDILTALHALPERPWGEWSSGKGSPPRPVSARILAQLLRPYRIKAQQIRIGSENNNGYTATSLADAWDRYIPRLEGGPKGLQGLHIDVPTSYDDSRPLRNSECRASELTITDCKINHVEDVEDGIPPSGGDMPSAEDKPPQKGRKEGRV